MGPQPDPTFGIEVERAEKEGRPTMVIDVYNRKEEKEEY